MASDALVGGVPCTEFIPNRVRQLCEQARFCTLFVENETTLVGTANLATLALHPVLYSSNARVPPSRRTKEIEALEGSATQIETLAGSSQSDALRRRAEQVRQLAADLRSQRAAAGTRRSCSTSIRAAAAMLDVSRAALDLPRPTRAALTRFLPKASGKKACTVYGPIPIATTARPKRSLVRRRVSSHRATRRASRTVFASTSATATCPSTRPTKRLDESTFAPYLLRSRHPPSRHR